MVYKGYDPFIKRTVAIKTCSSDDERVRLRFYREAEIAGNLIHPNITTIYDFGIQDDVPYLVEEFLTGEDLDHKIKRRADVPVGQRLDYLVQVARGLEYAHSQGVVHRDIKPGNIRILDTDRAKIMDFGTAKLANTDSRPDPGRDDPRHRRLHLARTDPGQRRRAGRRHLLLRGDRVRAVHLQPPVRRQAHRHSAPSDPQPATAADRRALARVSRLAGHLPRPVPGEGPGPSLARAGELLAALQGVIQEFARSRREAVEQARTVFLDDLPSGVRTPSGQLVNEPPRSSGIGTSPPAGNAPGTAEWSTAPPPPPPLPPLPTEAVGSMVERARQLQESHEPDRALLVASAAAEAAPEDAAVHELVRTVEEDLRAEVERERKRQASSAKVQEVLNLVERQDLPAALAALGGLEEELGSRSASSSTYDFASKRLSAGAAAEASATALARAERQMDRGQYRAARTQLVAALEHDPENPDLVTGLAAVRPPPLPPNETGRCRSRGGDPLDRDADRPRQAGRGRAGLRLRPPDVRRVPRPRRAAACR